MSATKEFLMAHADFNRELTLYLKDRTKNHSTGEGYLKKKKIKEPAYHEMPLMRDNGSCY